MKEFSLNEAVDLAKKLGIDFKNIGYSAEAFLSGLHVELEHGLTAPETNVTNDDPLITAKIVLAHLNENSLYYDKNIGVAAWEHALDQFKGDTRDKRIQII